MLIHAGRSVLLVIDVQEKLLPAMHDADNTLANIVWLTRLAYSVGVPVMASEQYPKGLGPTVADLRSVLASDALTEKVHFSCVAGECLDAIPAYGRPQVVIAGIEAHVCVLQTAMELKALGKEVFVVADCVSSRDPRNRELALDRLRDNQIEIVSREMVAFEWLRQAGTPLFKEISKAFLR